MDWPNLTLFRKIAPASSEAWWGDPSVQGLLHWLITQEGVRLATFSYKHALLRAWQQQTANSDTSQLADIAIQHPQLHRHNSYWVEMALARQTMIVESAIDYAVTIYGQEHLPALLEAIRRQDAWTAIVPEIFGVSVATFEGGWHEALAWR